MYCVGLDVHPTRTSVEILDCNGKLFKRAEVKGRWPQVLDELRKVPGPFAVCYEASCGYGHLYEDLSKLSGRVTVAHPKALAWIYRSKKKHNRADASKLAKLLYLDAVPAVYVPCRQVRQWRQTVEFRQKLLAGRVAVKNQIRSLLRGLGVVPPKGLWTGKGLAWLKGLELEEADALRRDLLVEQLEESGRKLKRVEKSLNQTAGGHAGVALLRTIPGVGPRTAEALAAYIDDVRRFRRVRCVGSYFGLVPCQDASGDKNRLGHITRDGPATVRKLLCEASWIAIRRSPTIRDFFEQVMRGDPDRKKIALVATAHRLAKVAAAMLRSGECWRERPDPAAAAESTVGGGKTPSGPQGFSPPPGTTPAAEASPAPPPLSASPFSPQGGPQAGPGPQASPGPQAGGDGPQAKAAAVKSVNAKSKTKEA